MQKRKFDELISYSNRKVADMDINTNYKMELLGMITAIGIAHEKELNAPTIEPERNKGRWISNDIDPEAWNFCSACGEQAIDLYDFCPNCGAEMTEGKG